MLILALVAAVLAALVYLQFRTWQEFDWAVFAREMRRVSALRVGVAVAIIYFVYYLRAVRWKIFLRPVCRTTAARLTAPQLIGFTGLALLGRPGEFIRPYLIARRENLSFSSQVAVWAVERIFDVGSVALLLAVVLFSGALRSLAYFQKNPGAHDAVRNGGFLLLGGVVAVALGAMLLRRRGPTVAGRLEAALHGRAPGVARRLSHRIHQFSQGLNTIHDAASFVAILGISLLIWTLIAAAYVQVLHAYPELEPVRLPQVVLLLVASMAGSVLQLPAIGGGSQLATIAVLQAVFGVRPELAVSAGILLWLVTFVAVVPGGLALARREHVSLRQLESEAEAQAET